MPMTFAKRVFFLAGIYGLVVLLPQYFMEERTGRDFPPPVTHPEYFYGFIGVAVAWQIVFLIISRDPVRYRPIMLAAIERPRDSLRTGLTCTPPGRPA